MYQVFDADGKFVKESGSLSDAKRMARRKGGWVEYKGQRVWPKGAR